MATPFKQGSVQGNIIINGTRSREFVSVSFSGAANLTGRAGDLAVLSDVFAGDPSTPVVRVLTGERGVGKSALAAAYGHRHRDRYGSMLWVDAGEPSRLDEQCRNLLNVLAPGEAAVDNPVDVLHGHLATKDKRWLLILDNVLDPNMVQRLIPAAGPGNVIITSAATRWRGYAATDVEPLAFDASTSLLLDVVEDLSEQGARAVATVIGGLPRSLVRAGEHLATNTAVDWVDFLRLYTKGLADRYVTDSVDTARVVGRARRNTVAAGSLRDGRQELFVVDGDRRLVRRWNDPLQPYGPNVPSSWSRWWPMDEPEDLHRVACSSLHTGHLEVFAVTGDQGLVHRWYEGSPGQWQLWRVLAAPGKVAWIAAGSPRDDFQDLFVVTTDGQVFTRGFPDGDRRDWTGWTSFDAPEPVIAMAWSGMNRPRGHRELFVVTGAGQVLHRWNNLDSNSDWSGWSELDVPGRVRTVTAGSHQQLQQYLIVVLDNGAVFARRYDGTHNGWEPDWAPMSASEPIVAITSSSMTTGHLELFATTRHGTLLHRWYWTSAGWTDWRPFE